MRPGNIRIHKPFQVQRRGNTSAITAFTDIVQIGYRTVEQRLVRGVQRHGPERILDAVTLVLQCTCKPGIIAGCLLVFIPCLGAFIAPNLLGGGKKLMLGSLVQFQFASARNWPFAA